MRNHNESDTIAELEATAELERQQAEKDRYDRMVQKIIDKNDKLQAGINQTRNRWNKGQLGPFKLH